MILGKLEVWVKPIGPALKSSKLRFRLHERDFSGGVKLFLGQMERQIDADFTL